MHVFIRWSVSTADCKKGLSRRRRRLYRAAAMQARSSYEHL